MRRRLGGGGTTSPCQAPRHRAAQSLCLLESPGCLLESTVATQIILLLRQWGDGDGVRGFHGPVREGARPAGSIRDSMLARVRDRPEKTGVSSGLIVRRCVYSIRCHCRKYKVACCCRVGRFQSPIVSNMLFNLFHASPKLGPRLCCVIVGPSRYGHGA